MKKIKLTAILFAAILLILALPFSASAANAQISISASGSVTVGSQVKVTVKVSSADKIGSWLFALKYDPSALEYVSGADSGGGGAVRFSDSLDAGVKSLSKTVTFKTKKITSTTVSVSSPQIVGFDTLQNMSVSNASKTIKINAKPTYSSDNKLSALSVAEGELLPAFDAATTAYTLSVPFETTAVTVSATANHKAASVSVDAPALVVGENAVTVTVKAENGSTKKYTITVTRQQSELAGVTAKVNEKDYSVAYDPATLTVPEGYTATPLLYGEKKILTYAAPQNAIYIAYLISEADSGWYVYNAEEQLFSPYLALTGSAAPYVILDLPQGLLTPTGYIPAELTVGETTVPAYKTDDSALKNVYLVYAMSKDGNCGFYYYDATANSFVSYFEVSLPTDAEEGDSLEEVKSMLEEEKKTSNRMEVFFLVAALTAALFFVGMILSLVFVRRPKKEKEAYTSETNNDSAPTDLLTEENHNAEFQTESEEKNEETEKTKVFSQEDAE